MKTKSPTQPAQVYHSPTVQNLDDFKQQQNLSKSERFLKYAGGRVAQALRAVENLGHCSDLTRYEYTDEQVKKMFSELRRVLDETEKKFEPKARQRWGRNFFQDEGDN